MGTKGFSFFLGGALAVSVPVVGSGIEVAVLDEGKEPVEDSTDTVEVEFVCREDGMLVVD